VLQLRLDNVEQRFGARRVLKGITATASSGECLVVTGPNGSGKSTLLAIIAGLLRPSRGEVRLEREGRLLAGDERRDCTGLVAPALALYDELTAAENLQFFACLRSLELGNAMVEELLARVGLEGRGRDLVGSYSSGMQVRLKYAAALLHRPGLLLLDEPTANLDAAGAVMSQEVIREQRALGIVVLATNDPAETGLGDRVVSLG
jgi:heme exporter protein A